MSRAIHEARAGGWRRGPLGRLFLFEVEAGKLQGLRGYAECPYDIEAEARVTTMTPFARRYQRRELLDRDKEGFDRVDIGFWPCPHAVLAVEDQLSGHARRRHTEAH